ncbi:hypothetical protein PG997_008442 [Apiospora hydei]|uniref:Protein kinase domain-containing protein n=1 Tax=Apiospora hydei TaxID=1337664 RepID=A0ABR1WAV5_9PEZI
MGSRFTNNIGLYFANDFRYKNEEQIGEGAFGCVFKIKDNQAADSTAQRFALKVPFSKDSPSGEDTWISEIGALDVSLFQFSKWPAAHIVNNIPIADDPLRRRPTGATLIASGWIYLEYLENGTFRQFVTRLRTLDRTVPNRLIWRITLCLVRMCIAVAWPNTYSSGTERIEEVERDNYAHIISNTDLHDENMMFSNLDTDGSLEHQLTPVLKMIDMGDCQRQRIIDFTAYPTIYQPFVCVGLRKSPNEVPLDTEIAHLAMMSDRDEVDLRVVARDVLTFVTTRTEAWYRAKYPREYNVDLKTDAAVRNLVNAVFFDADRTSTV